MKITGEFRVTKDTNFAGLQALAQRLRANMDTVLVGVPAGAEEKDGTPLALVAAANEFGTSDGRIPERAFLRRLRSRRHQRYLMQVNRASLIPVVAGRSTMERALERLGTVAVGIVKREIAEGRFAPNAPSTIAKKGSERPLIDTGQLRQSITWMLDRGAAETPAGMKVHR